ncbi:hypothetical protein B0T18DRAFT_430818 [Schizothecium vesticola]|uniref:Uncharacterized protein n=1 Tax=Schizothecium vesticola TaxID=314040 RepID=A0AA40EQC4_9PEZI|nr:hypothetical protein B0T18DRAFT_430818 [Schizothecium vesticola]
MAPPVTFRRYRPLPPTIDRQLFSYFFAKGPERYTFWRDDYADYQLRVFGGPGTGKTTLAALIVEDLRREFPGATIVSVFLEESNTDTDGIPEPADIFIQRFQAEVLDQTREKAPPCDDTGGNPRFLLVDDIDILWETPTTYHALEAELRKFRAAGWRVAATTRVLYPLRKDANMNWWSPECDSSQHEGARLLDDDICEHGAEHFIQPYAEYGLETLEVVICDLSSEMAGFIGRELQREHGNLQLDATSSKSCPPLSPLGRSLLATGQAQGLLSELKTRAGGNVSLALLRLEYTRAHSSAEEAISAMDRLPTQILAAFRAIITRVCASSEGGLGLDAIKVVGAARNHEMEWKTLHSVLAARGWGSRLGPEEVVAASGGLLKTRHASHEHIRCYHFIFGLFVSEGYDERLGLPRTGEAQWAWEAR